MKLINLFFRKKYLFILSAVFVGTFLFTTVEANDTKNITIVFKTNPSYVNISKAALKYNKEFVFSINADDGWKDSYSIFYKLLNGGRIANSDTISKGFYFTDGAGNKVPFRGNFQLTTMNSNIGDSFIPIRTPGSTAYVDWDEAKIAADRGWDTSNHGWSHNAYPDPIDRIFPYPEPHGPSIIDYDYEIEQNQISIEANTGYRPIIMGSPDADPGYDPYIFNNHGLFAKIKKYSPVNRYTQPGMDVGSTVDLNQFNIMGYVYMPTYGSVLADSANDIINFVDFIKNSSVGGSHYWNRLSLHRFYEDEGLNGMGLQSLEQILNYIDDNYGANGADNGWIASSQEVYEYLYAKQNSNLSQRLSENTLTVTVDFGEYPAAFKRQSLSLMIDADAEIENVYSTDPNTNISFNASSGLINIDWKFFNNDAFEKDCSDKVVIAENTRSQADLNEADDYVNAMDSGALKTDLVERLSNVKVLMREWYISFGVSMNSTNNLYRGLIWNGVNSSNIQNKSLDEANGEVSGLIYDTVNAFGGLGSNGVVPSPSDSGKYPDNISKAYAYPSTSPPTPIIIKLSYLNPDKYYDIEIFSSKTSAGTSTYFVVGAATSSTLDLNMYNNTDNTVIFSKIKPSINNDVEVNVASGGRLTVIHLTERPKIEEPVVTKEAATYNMPQTVALSALESDFIKYSYSGTPTDCSDGLLYSAPLTISTSRTVYIRACDNAGNSAIASYAYVIDSVAPEVPAASVAPGLYNTTRSVELGASGSDYIKYSFVDMPTDCSYGYLYSGPVEVASSETIYVRACDNAGNSTERSFSYVIDKSAPGAPSSSIAAGNYSAGQTVTLLAEGSDYIRYSFEGALNDCSEGTAYSDPLQINQSQTLYVRACDNAGNSSSASFTYIISIVKNDSEINKPTISGSLPIAPLATGQGLVSSFIPMNSIGNIGAVNVLGTNILGYINSQANFSVPASSNSWLPVNHNFRITDLNLFTNTITLTISSDPQILVLKKGGSQEVDLDNDGKNDIDVTFVGLYVNRAEITIKSLDGTRATTSGVMNTSNNDDAVISQEQELSTSIDRKLTARLAGRILLQVEMKGQAWYLDPVSLARYYLADGGSAFGALRKFGLGITNNDLIKIPVASDSALPDSYVNSSIYSSALINRLKGRIVLQVEDHGEAWYIDPASGQRYYLADGNAAYQIMRNLSLGISNMNIRTIAVGK